MRPSTPSPLRAIHSRRYLKPCHSVSNPFLARTTHSFPTSLIRAKHQDDPTRSPEAAWSHAVEEPVKIPRFGNNSKEVEERTTFSEGGQNTPTKPVDKSNYGSAMNRAYRNAKKTKDIPILQIPQWFLDSNVILREDMSGNVNGQYFHPDRPETSPIEQESPTTTPATEKSLEDEASTTHLNPEKLKVSPTEKPSISIAPSADQNAEDERPNTDVSGNLGVTSTEKPPVPSSLKPEHPIEINSNLQENRLGNLQGHEDKHEENVKDIRTVLLEEIRDQMGQHKMDANIMRPYRVDARIMQEISSLVSAGLKISSAQLTTDWTSSKSDLVFMCPVDGGSFFLDELVKNIASVKGTDLVRLDPQDIAEIGGNYLEERRDTHAKSLSSLGYDAYRQSSEHAAMRESHETEDPEEDNEQEDMGLGFGRIGPGPRAFHASVISLPNRDPSHLGRLIQSALTNGIPSSSQNSASHGKGRTQAANVTSGLMMEQFVETVLDTTNLKRATKDLKEESEVPPEVIAEANGISTDNAPRYVPSSDNRTDSLIVMVRDYPEINSTYAGGKVLEKLHEVVRRRRKDGQRILVIGTSSSQDLMSSLSKSRLHQIESEPDDGPTRTVIVPCSDGPRGNNHQRRTGLINLRNLQDMLRRLAPSPLQIDLMSESAIYSDLLISFPSENRLLELKQILFLLGQHIWPLDSVHFVATVTLGLLQDQEQLTARHVLRALDTRSASYDAKFEWMDREKEQEKEQDKISNLISSKPPHQPLSHEATEERMRKLRKICNTHETRLLNGVVDAGSIRTAFADIQAPPETIETLKTITSLSLIRPDAFTYGVLATDKIPGLLLYGPPGTGKTLLVKAVAKESGATVLEVSGSDIYDMYVGEGEKNVKAIFSLAKKLTPCIVFIDEADAILGSRGGPSSRTSHRELINQFLREWDGMNEHSAYIMVATNRPYDLDEACLRRLPRRLLVDLPTERDREAILRIHLKDESLDPAVSLQNLASQTPFYSGSDLKNLAVAAALACVREEIQQSATAPNSSSVLSETDQPAVAAAPSSETTTSFQRHPKPVYPEKRTLLPRHFARAQEEISASISEDMGSLNEIRKFDEKYGDRRGRRKGLQGYGFNTVKEGAKARSDAARVRNR